MPLFDPMHPMVTVPGTFVNDVVDDLPPLVGFEAAAERLGVDRSTLQRWVNAGRLSVVKTSSGRAGRTLVPRMEIARLVHLMTKRVEQDPGSG